MFDIFQGDILSIDRVSLPVLVVSKDFFNRSEQIIACPIQQKANSDPLHIFIRTDEMEGYVLCEQMKLLDLRIRGYKKIAELKLNDIMEVADTIQCIFDYYPCNR